MLKSLLAIVLTLGLVGGALYGFQTRIDNKSAEAKEAFAAKVAQVKTENNQNTVGDVSRNIGRAAGQFGAGVAESVTDSTRVEWITIEPRSREECIAASNGVLDRMYMRCRNGRQEMVRFDAKGRKVVISERPIPTH